MPRVFYSQEEFDSHQAELELDRYRDFHERDVVDYCDDASYWPHPAEVRRLRFTESGPPRRASEVSDPELLP